MGADLDKASKKGTDAQQRRRHCRGLRRRPRVSPGPAPIPSTRPKTWPEERTQLKKAFDFIEAGTPGDGAPRHTVVDVHRDLAARTAEVADHQHPRPSPAEEATPSTPPEAAAPASIHRTHPVET